MEKVQDLGVQAVHDEKNHLGHPGHPIMDSVTDTYSVDDVVDWLNQVKMLDELIDAKIAEREQWLELGTKITPVMTGMPHAPGVSDKVGNAAIKLADLIDETNDLVDKFIDHKQEVCQKLEQLSAEEYGVLHRHFVQYKTLGEIAAEMNYCYMQIWRFKNSGLEHLKDILNV